MKTPLFTVETSCQDCYKCVRSCPVKAIRVQEHHAVVANERCIVCGECVQVCPAGAQRVRKDLPRLEQLLQLKKSVYLSLAPSFAGEFAGGWQELLPKLKTLGFTGVSETAHGADLISELQVHQLREQGGVILSTACPVVVELVSRYFPELEPNLSELSSPMIAHGRQLKKLYGDDSAVVFAGPCVAKKLESDRLPDAIDLALTFAELQQILDGVEPARGEMVFVPSHPLEGVIYPLDGGMVETMQSGQHSILESGFANISGLDQVITTLRELVENPTEGPLFCELLACEGGCINGPGSCSNASMLTKRIRMSRFCRSAEKAPAGEIPFPEVVAEEVQRKKSPVPPIEQQLFTREEMHEALMQLDKYSKEDELDCGGCGYNSCRDFAGALLSGLAEIPMCVTAMRKRAQNKVNALISSIPMGVIIIDRDGRIVECNKRFITFFVEDDLPHTTTGMFRGARLEQFFPLKESLGDALSKGNATEKIVTLNGRVLQFVVFPIEGQSMTGLLFQDITAPSMKRETVIKKAEEVITKSLQSVQQIASLLGENAAETEIILNSLIDAFSPDELSKGELS